MLTYEEKKKNSSTNSRLVKIHLQIQQQLLKLNFHSLLSYPARSSLSLFLLVRESTTNNMYVLRFHTKGIELGEQYYDCTNSVYKYADVAKENPL